MARKVAYRKRNSNKFSTFLVCLVIIMLSTVVAVKSKSLTEKLEVYSEKEAQLQSQLEAEEVRALEIEEYRKYTQTKKYIEEMAKEKLGLVYPDEKVFIED